MSEKLFFHCFSLPPSLPPSLSPLAVANGLQYECVYQVMEDFPPNSDSSNVVLKSGDRIIQVRLTVNLMIT